MREPKIIFIASGLGRGGAELQLLQVATGLFARHWMVSVLTMQPAGPYQQMLVDKGIPVLEVPCGRLARPSTLHRLIGHLRKERPDVVHTHAFRANLWGRLAAIACAVPVVASVRATYRYLPSAYYPVERWLGRRSARVITPAAATTKHLIEVVGVPAEKVTTIPNAVDLAMFTAVRSGASFRRQYGLDDAFVVLAPGRLAAQKDHASLFGAFRFLLSTQYESRLVIAGTGPLEGNLKSSVADLRDRVVFTGDLDRRAMADAMAAADCVCLSSRFEGMPNVLLEAMASGKPCVSSATDGAGEVIRHGVDGFVTAIGNSHAMGSALATLAADSGLRRSMGIAARSRAEAEYAIPTNVARHENVYKEAAFGQEGPVA